MKNRVYKLKKKHRNRIWVDDEGDFWYWDCVTEAWALLQSSSESPGFELRDEYTPDCVQWFVPVAESAYAGLH